MMKVIGWVKKNKLASFLIVILLVLIAKDFLSNQSARQIGYSNVGLDESSMVASSKMGEITALLPPEEVVPSESKERLVVQTSSLSLVVNDVRQVSKEVVNYTQEIGGFMVSASLDKPQEVPFATVVVRVPAEKLSETLDYFRSLAVKVSSENILGKDVTDQYEDIGTKLETLNKTKAKFEEILNKAEKVEDILKVQRELTSLQAQIDNLKGRKEYWEKTAKLAKITTYLSTDELSLPYQPEGVFRPKVIFKQAVRSLIETLRSFAKLVIWVAVYLPIWGAILIIIFIAKWLKRRKKKI
ncbi:hypothetical protein COT63_01555 [Candidatus Shapirobacteria bacterium CG09_land_8_20_14_0_10_38_17]|uniref:DUF4349 domain-containing protein n=1 Tax=Candidatus Shapirobacteria bacterium CG09_land_8_20_14_0_10_38_17 TaxID=1974884 RepID=A0A2H0WR84_9BACT|nr:MAG: hypothetical protein COT63_01555 [Candidatus Shapirobacteria bacterium CG09_land_8_20_14_0_10_38_17]